MTFFVWMMILLGSMRAAVQENQITSISKKQMLEIGSSVELECNLGNMWDTAEVAWVKMMGVGETEYLSIFNKEEGVKDYDDEYISRMDEDLTWYLELSVVTLSMGGLYQCQVLLADEVVSSRDVMVTVLDPNTVAHNTKYMISKHGGNVTLDCTDLDGEDGEDANWTRVGGSSVVQNGKTLSLILVDRSDSGVYVCSVSGGARTLNFSLLVEHSPTVIPNESTIYQAPGYPAHLSCQVSAVPVPAVVWYRIGQSTGPAMIKSNGDVSIMIEDYKDGVMTSSLIFDNTTTDHYGQYSCNASNLLGQNSAAVSFLYSDTPVLQHSTAGQYTVQSVLLLVMLCYIVSTGV